MLCAWFNYRSYTRRIVRLFLMMVAFSVVSAVTGGALFAHARGIPLAELFGQRWAQLLSGFFVGALAVSTPLAIVVVMRNWQYRVLSAKLE